MNRRKISPSFSSSAVRGFKRPSAIAAGPSRYSPGPGARTQEYGVLYGILHQQSNLKAYVDLFCWTALIMAVCLPGAGLLKKSCRQGQLGSALVRNSAKLEDSNHPMQSPQEHTHGSRELSWQA